MAAAADNNFDLIVIGGGSGGIASAKRAAEYGAKVCVFEQNRYGGTCVNVGCVPKKIMFMTSNISSVLRSHAQEYCFDFDQSSLKFDLGALKVKRDAYIKYLNGIYERGIDNLKITRVEAAAKFVDPNTIVASRIDPATKKNVFEGQTWKAKKVLIAVGGFPYVPQAVKGHEHIATSDDFFNKLDYLPVKTCVVGAGYIAVELAQVLQGLGSETHLFIRHGRPLRKFDELVQKGVMNTLLHSGVTVHKHANITEVRDLGKKNAAGRATFGVVCKESEKECLEGFDYVLYAIGRGPLQEELGLDKVPKLKQDKRGFILADEWEQTAQEGVFALGDINNKIALTPVAIRAGRKFGDREFGGKKDAKMDYANVPSVVFTEPPVGSCGLPEFEVREMVDKGTLPGPVTVYESHFRNLYYGMMEEKKKLRTHMKIVCAGKDEKVVGLHLVGEGCDEMLQGFGVAMKMGATKEDFDSCTAIHPTASEELVTLKKPREKDDYVYEYEKDDQKSDD